MVKLKEYFSFKGKATRIDYWYVIAITAIVLFLLRKAIVVIGPFDSNSAAMFFMCFEIVLFATLLWVNLAAIAKRFRDIGKSGWLVLP